MSSPLHPVKITVFCLLLSPFGLVIAQNCQSSIDTITEHLVEDSNNKGIVIDSNTGLEWKKCSEGQSFDAGGNTCTGSTVQFSWQAALQRAQEVNVATDVTGGLENLGKDDWRVPTKKELDSIIELSCTDPAINETVFPATSSGSYWSSSQYARNSLQAWAVNFNSGNDTNSGKANSTNHDVRLVRNGR